MMADSIFGIIYKITNKVNGKIYIGQTTSKRGFEGRYPRKGIGIERVYNYYLSCKKAGHNINDHLFYSIEKYGFDSFDVDEKFDIAYSLEELNEKEIYYINFYKSNNSNLGYNKQEGGFNGTPSDNTRIKMSENNWLKKGGTPWNKDKTGIYSSSTIEKMKKNHADFKGENHPRTKRVICLTTGIEFNYVREASLFYNCDESTIIKCCKGKRKHCGNLEDGTKLSWAYL